MRLLLALLLPWLMFFTIGRIFAGLISLVLQLSGVGWIVATIWAVYALSQYKTGLFIIKGGRPVFIKLVFSTNRLNGGNTDVPNRFYLRFAGFNSSAGQTGAGHSCVGATQAPARVPVLPVADRAHQGHAPAHAQAHAPG